MVNCLTNLITQGLTVSLISDQAGVNCLTTLWSHKGSCRDQNQASLQSAESRHQHLWIAKGPVKKNPLPVSAGRLQQHVRCQLGQPWWRLSDRSLPWPKQVAARQRLPGRTSCLRRPPPRSPSWAWPATDPSPARGTVLFSFNFLTHSPHITLFTTTWTTYCLQQHRQHTVYHNMDNILFTTTQTTYCLQQHGQHPVYNSMDNILFTTTQTTYCLQQHGQHTVYNNTDNILFTTTWTTYCLQQHRQHVVYNYKATAVKAWGMLEDTTSQAWTNQMVFH